MPMFMRRLTVLGASLVWSVDSTRWPVSAALTAISAVSKSRISPTRMMFGSCRRNDRSAAAKFSPMFSLTCTWLTPTRLNSTGSSAVMMLVSIVLTFEIAEHSVFVLPLPVGPVTRTMPHGRRMAASNLVSDSGSNPSFVMSSISLSLSSSRMTIFSPKSVGRTDTRKSISFAVPLSLKRILMRLSCGSRFSAMSSFARILMRDTMASRYFIGGLMML